MNPSITILADSTCDLLPRQKQQVQVIPLTVRFGQQEYIDGVTIDHQKFYQLLESSEALPTTSAAAPGDFLPVFQKVHAAGQSAVVITISSRLSATYQSACIAAAEFDNIYVVDSQSAAIGAGILVSYAQELARQGLDAAQISRQLEQQRSRIRIIARLETLEYLKRGGRLSAAAALAGSLLNIKPVLCLQEGQIQILGKARGSKAANNLLAQQIGQAGGVDFSMPVLLGYTGTSDALLQQYVRDCTHLWAGESEKLEVTAMGSVLGTHVGPGAVAVAFFQKT